MPDLANLNPQQCRHLIRDNQYCGPTPGLGGGYLQANLVILPQDIAEDFQEFARLNPKPCPLLEILGPGETQLTTIADADVTTDFPAYRVFEYTSVTEEVSSVCDLWQDDLVSFLIGCSFTTDHILQQQNIMLNHVQHNTTIPIYISNQVTQPTHYFSGPLAVSMRSIKRHQLEQAIAITQDYPLAHGAPVHCGDPQQLGINDITEPAYGVYYPIAEDEVPVFWACGVTPQLCAQHNKINLMITHKPGHMLICDLTNQALYKKKAL